MIKRKFAISGNIRGMHESYDTQIFEDKFLLVDQQIADQIGLLMKK